MLYIATVHYQSPHWIELQTRRLHEHISVPHRIWTSLEGIDSSYGKYFDRVVEQYGGHAGKLNHLAIEIGKEAADDDLLMFIDGDAFPIADPMPMLNENLERYPVIAVRRAENVDEPQPHPCFCVTTVRTWRALPGDWSLGYPWTGPRGNRDTDVGGNLLRALELTETPWLPLLRSASATDHPLLFGTYGGLIYHHGTGFREGVLTRVDRDGAPRPVPLSSVSVLRPLTRVANSLRWRWWERREKQRSAQESQAMYRKLQYQQGQ